MAGVISAEDFQSGFEPSLDAASVRYIADGGAGPRTLYDAARRGDLALLKELIETKGCDLNEVDEWDASPLYYACYCGHEPCVRFLLERGAHCEEDSFDGERCHYAALTDRIRRILKEYEAANRQRGPIYAFTFRMLDNANAFPDVTLCIDRENFVIDAHKFLLAARSPWFRRQFAPGGRWATRRYISFTSPKLSAVALKTVISYMYTDRLVCPEYALPGVLQLAQVCGLTALVTFIQESSTSWKASGTGIIGECLSGPYAVGAVPPADTSALRGAVWHHLLADNTRALQLSVSGDRERGMCLDNGIPFDMQIVCGGVTFHCHRAIVALRCPYFAAMLHFYEESSDPIPQLQIADFSVPMMQRIVEFLYCDTVRPFEDAEHVLEALEASDVLGLTSSMRACLVTQAIQWLQPSTVCDFLHVADLYDLRRLTVACARIAAASLDALLLDPAFANLVHVSAQSILKREHVDSIPVLDAVASAVYALHAPSVSDNVFDGRDKSTDPAFVERSRKLAALHDFATSLGYSVQFVGE